MSNLAAEWDGLPDPRDASAPDGIRCRVQLRTWAWRHIAAKHIAPREEPWDEWLALAVNASSLEQGSGEVFAVLGNRLRLCLERPLAIVSGVGTENARPSVTTWQLVLPGGALLIVRCGTRGHPHVITCFFPRVVLRERKPHLRWRRLVAKLVERHAQFQPDGGTIVPPDGNVRFVTAQTWGFRPELRGCPWRGTLTDSPGYDAAIPQAKRKLKPRQQAGEAMR